jgi:hypothetical protein
LLLSDHGGKKHGQQCRHVGHAVVAEAALRGWIQLKFRGSPGSPKRRYLTRITSGTNGTRRGKAQLDPSGSKQLSEKSPGWTAIDLLPVAKLQTQTPLVLA